GWLRSSDACVVDLRPAEVVPVVEIGLAGGRTIGVGGLLVDPERRGRHAAADAALADVLARGVLSLVDEEQFWFFRHAASADELRDYISSRWKTTPLDAATHAEAAGILRRHRDACLWMRERVGIRSLRRPG